MNDGAFAFAQPHAVHWLWLVAIATGLAIVGLRRRRRLLALLAEQPLLARLAPTLDPARGWLRAAVAMLGMGALTLAIMDPRWGMEVEQVQRRGLDVVFVVDVSRSMLARDATPSRLERAKQFVSDAIDSLGGDRVGLVDFAGVAAVRTPLTLNRAALRQAVRDLEPKASSRGGSMLGEAIRLAARSFPSTGIGSRVIIVLSDGEDMGSAPAEAARAALEEHEARVFTVGLGDARDGARVPLANGRFLVHDGQEVWSRMNPDTLREVAEAGGGAFIQAGTAQVDMAAVCRDTLGELDRVDQQSSVVKRQTPRFQWFAGAALLLLLVESLVTDRRAPKVGAA